MLTRKTEVVAIALAYHVARTIFAVFTDGSRYEPQIA